jgi:Dishevelled specific domain
MVSGQYLIVGWDQALFKFVDLAAFYVLFVSCNFQVNPISNCETLGLQAPRANGQAGRHQRSGHGYESSSMISSELETTSCLDSEDDATSRITTTTGRLLFIVCTYWQNHPMTLNVNRA